MRYILGVIREEGAKAYKRGVAICPYPEKSQEGIEWYKGWTDEWCCFGLRPTSVTCGIIFARKLSDDAFVKLA